MNDQTNDQTVTVPSPLAMWLGRLSAIFAIAGWSLVFAKDPFWLAAPTCLVAVVLGTIAVRREPDHSAGGHIGMNMGIFGLLLWVVLILVLEHLVGTDFELFAALAYP